MPIDLGRTITTKPGTHASPYVFFLLVFCLSIPFYFLGAAGGRLPGLSAQPTSALMAFMPMIAALILVYCERGTDEVANLVKRAVDFDRVRDKRWYLVAVCLLPIVAVLQYAALHLTEAALPAPRYAFGLIPVISAMYFFGAVGEELGWQGYAFPDLRTRYSAIPAALMLGVFWALWHVIPFVQTGRTSYWIFWHCLSIVAFRIIIVWLFVNNGQSVFITVLFHTMINLPWSVIANYEAFYDPFITFVILLLVTGSIIAFWRPQNEPTEGNPHV